MGTRSFDKEIIKGNQDNAFVHIASIYKITVDEFIRKMSHDQKNCVHMYNRALQ